MLVDELVKKVSEISKDTQYWFVRTNDGEYFQYFVDGNYIGIGWNPITMEDLQTKSEFEVKGKIAIIENVNTGTTEGKRKVSDVYNKIVRFKDLRKGDIVIIPSRGSSRFAFGEVADAYVYIENNDKDCPFYKRRKINWITVENTHRLDPMFYQVKNSRHTISNVDAYANYIDNVIRYLYIKDDNAHFILDFLSHDGVNIDSLIDLLTGIKDLMSELNVKFQLGEDIGQSEIRLNLQSPGSVEIKLPSGKTLILLAATLAISACGADEVNIEDKAELEVLVQENPDSLQKIHNAFDSMQADHTKINSF